MNADVKDIWERWALRELEGVLASGFPAMRTKRASLGQTITQLKNQIRRAQLKYNLLTKRLKDAPKTHAQLVREMNRSVNDAIGGAQL